MDLSNLLVAGSSPRQPIEKRWDSLNLKMTNASTTETQEERCSTLVCMSMIITGKTGRSSLKSKLDSLGSSIPRT